MSSPRARASRRSATALLILAPPIALAATVAYGLSIAHWVLATPDAQAPATCLLVLPLLGVELLLTRCFEVPVLGWRRGVIAGCALRLLVQATIGFAFVVVPVLLEYDADGRWFVQDLTALHHFVKIFWMASPAPAAVAAVAILTSYLAVTARTRRWRFVTTMLLPGVATVALYALMYYLPTAWYRGQAMRQRPAFVERVWTSVEPSHAYPREVAVARDGRTAIATFGSTFPLRSPADVGDNLAICGINPRDCRPNIALVDLTTGETRTWDAPVTRRFYSEDAQRAFVFPWHTGHLVEVGFDGRAVPHPVPEEIGGAKFREPISTYFAADVGRVYFTNGNNPVLVAWDVTTGAIDRVLQFAGWDGVVMGDTTVNLARSRRRKRLYLWLKASPNRIVEVDETTLTPTRSIRPSPDAYTMEVSPDEQTLFAASFFSGRIYRYRLDTLELEAEWEAPVQCRRMVLSADGARLFAASYLTGELVTYDVARNRALGSIFVAPRLEGMHLGEDALYLLSSAGLDRIALSDLPSPSATNASTTP